MPAGTRSTPDFQRRTNRRGLNQAEVAVSTIIVGVLMVASFSSIAASKRSQILESNKVRGSAIAEALLTEITQLPMRDPVCDCGYGTEASESGSSRIAYDDVDDYKDLIDSPPKTKSGSAILGFAGFSRHVEIHHVTTTNWNMTSSSYTGVYRITVKVLRGTVEACRTVGYRTSGSLGSFSSASFSSVD